MVPHWSHGLRMDHLQGSADAWMRATLEDHLRRSKYWAPLDTSIEMYVDLDRDEDDNSDSSSLRINLEQAYSIQSLRITASSSVKPSSVPIYRNIGCPVSYTHTDPMTNTRTTISAYVQALSTGGQTDHQVVLYSPPDALTPLATVPSGFWSHPDADSHISSSVASQLSIAQLMDIKVSPGQHDSQGSVRVLLTLAFGAYSGAVTDANDANPQVLDVVEIYIDGDISSLSSQTLYTPAPRKPRKHRVSTLQPSHGKEFLRGRAIKIYNDRNPLTNADEEHIAIFGIRCAEAAQTILVTSPLFYAPSNKPSSLKEHSPVKFHLLGDMATKTGLKTSCMAMFPPQSEFEQLIVIMNEAGKGEIWDWKHNKKIFELEIANNAQQKGEKEGKEPSNHRKDLYYWGVQINWTIEQPGECDSRSGRSYGLSHGARKRGDFRIVAMADGLNEEWETSWWHVGEQELRKRLQEVQDETLFQASATLTTESKIESRSRHFEARTLGTTRSPSELLHEMSRPSDEDHALLFVAYLVWDHYRIALTSEFGLCIFDMNKEMDDDILDGGDEKQGKHKSRNPHWVTMIDSSEQDPLIDIATLGDCLLLTRKYSHIVWPFRKLIRPQP
ncbi:hypothetical protein BG011_003392 [Mortierella polycephala]|uniref:Uncharacterized protein n=1 Tax=Mortierella polycephala TaxID=41804 RepID=A0A9P6Q4G6_9FUNG|nr:hypothetical protein BG011_003392 [Mortierella polycephala]